MLSHFAIVVPAVVYHALLKNNEMDQDQKITNLFYNIYNISLPSS